MAIAGQRGEMLRTDPFCGERCQHPLEPLSHSRSPGGRQSLLLQRHALDQCRCPLPAFRSRPIQDHHVTLPSRSAACPVAHGPHRQFL